MRDKDIAFRDVLKRAEAVKRRRDRNRVGWLSAATGVLTVLIVLIALQTSRVAEGTVNGAMGSFLLRAEAGGYILVAVLALGLGAFITLYFVKRATKQSQNNQNNGEEKNEG